jgi:hypothetical protein
MTCIAYRDGIIAADSQETDGNNIKTPCQKLFRIAKGKNKGHILATQGASFSGMVFVDWYAGAREEMPSSDRDLIDSDDAFGILLLTPKGLFEVDKSCRPVPISTSFYAIGDGGPIAMGAMEMGASARRAVAAACKWNIHCSGPVAWMELDDRRGKR